MPNKTKKFDKDDELLFECECGGNHYLQLYNDIDEKELSLYYIEQPVGLWRTLKWWWTESKIWCGKVILSPDDLKELAKAINKHLKAVESHKMSVTGFKRKEVKLDSLTK